jgi:hypothetical protein
VTAQVTIVVRIEEGKRRGLGVSKFNTTEPLNSQSKKWYATLRRSRAIAMNDIRLNDRQRSDEEAHQLRIFPA